MIKKYSLINIGSAFYPILLVVLFILAKFQIREVNPMLSDIICFMIANMAIYFISFIGLNYLIKDTHKTSLIIFLFLIFVLYYHQIKIKLLGISFFRSFFKILLSNDRIMELCLTLSLVLLLILLATLIIRSKKNFLLLTRYLNLLLIFLIIFQLYEVLNQNTRKIKLVNTEIENVKSIVPDRKIYPDIYYLILDGYTSNKSLTEFWNFDNSSFTDFLREKGFWIADSSHTNYNMTPYSLSSSLNMSYLSHVPKELPSDAVKKNLFDLVYNNNTCKTLAKYNYRIINMSFFDILNYPRDYDDYFFLLRAKTVTGTLYEPFLGKVFRRWKARQIAGLLSLKDTNLNILRKIDAIAGTSEKPLFIYAHVLMPHDPYFFDEKGKPDTTEAAIEPVQKDKYLGQLKYLNGLIENTVRSILSKYSDKPPVIIIQGDHGWRYLSGKDKTRESLTILNAYFFPDHDYSQLYPSISPVNSFRIIFNKYFDLGLPILKDNVTNVFVF